MASQSGSYYTYSTADKAVDGNNNPKMNAESCVHPDTSFLSGQERNQPAWWRVDLGASYDIYQVLVTNREMSQGNSVIHKVCPLLTSKILIFQDILN